MFEKLFKDIPKMVRLFTKIIGVVGIVSAIIIGISGMTLTSSMVSFGNEFGNEFGMASGTVVFGVIISAAISVVQSLLIILAGEIVARVYSVWEKKNPEAAVSKSNVEANTVEANTVESNTQENAQENAQENVQKNTDKIEISEVEKNIEINSEIIEDKNNGQ